MNGRYIRGPSTVYRAAKANNRGGATRSSGGRFSIVHFCSYRGSVYRHRAAVYF